MSVHSKSLRFLALLCRGVLSISVVRFTAGGDTKVMGLDVLSVIGASGMFVFTDRGWRMYPDSTVLIAAFVLTSILSKHSEILLVTTDHVVGSETGKSGRYMSSSGLWQDRLRLHTP